MQTVCKLLFFLFLGILSASCSGTYITGSWTNPEINRQINDVYIVGISDTELNRRILEDTFNNEVAKHGINGISSYNDLPENKLYDEATIQKMMKANGTDSVIITRIINQRIQSVTSPGRISGYSSRARYFSGNEYDNSVYEKRPKYYRNSGSYFDRRSEVTIEPPSTTEFLVLTIESVLYDLKSGEKMWSGQLETVVEGKIENMMQDYVKLVASDLKIKKLI